MGSGVRSWSPVALSFLVLIAIQHVPKATALVASPDFNPPYPKAISDLKEAIVKGFGFQSDDLKVSDFNVRDALVGKSVEYEFDLEIDNKVIPFKLLEDVNRWEYIDLPIFQPEPQVNENGLVERKLADDQKPVLAPFQLAGPIELWIQDARDMRISLPHDVDAGELKKVILADGAVVTVKGARSVSLRHPIELPLPLNRTSTSNFASGLITLAEHLSNAARSDDAPLLSLRIVGPTSLASPPASPSSSSSSSRLKLKRLAPGLVELSSAPRRKSMDSGDGDGSSIQLQGEATALLAPDRFATLWPITSLAGANANLVGFEALLSSVMGPKANQNGSFKLLKAHVSAQTFVKIGFAVEKKVKEGDLVGFPEWRTRPENTRVHFEVVAKLDGNKFVPERVLPVQAVVAEESIAPNVVLGNVSLSKVPVVHQPISPFSL